MSNHKGVPIIIVDLCASRELNLSRLVKKLNKHQNVFIFNAWEKGAVSLGKFKPEVEPHTYTWEQFFNGIKKATEKAGYVYGIGITLDRLPQNKFNYHCNERNVGVITVADHEEYNPPGKSLEQYVAYLSLCEAFCLVAKTHLEHGDVKYCLFDECYEKSDLRKCLRTPYIHDKCKETLKHHGFTDDNIKEAEKLLSYIKRPSLFYGIKKGLGSLISALLLGMLIRQLFVTYPIKIVSEGKIELLIILAAALCISIGVSGFIPVKFRKRRSKKKHKS